MSYQATIGLEIHVQLKTRTKLFCGCPIDQASEPNTNVCEVCLGHPGTLPRLNRAAVQHALRAALALDMNIAEAVRFDRKHYVYPDLSKNFQTSQFYTTLGRGGLLEYEIQGMPAKARLTEGHLEEDAAKLEHTPHDSRVDFNRCGTPLFEIVTEPEFHSGEEAEAALRHLQLLMRTIGASEANQELGQLRCDVNVSVARRGADHGTRVELKNLNSSRFVRLAIEHETERQKQILEAGGEVRRETRSWNDDRGVTQSMRSKEEAHDYRYLAEPDIGVVNLDDDHLQLLRAELPELPVRRLVRLAHEYGITPQVSRELVADQDAVAFFEQCAGACGNAKLAADWMLNQVRELHNREGASFHAPPVPPARLGELLRLIKEERISNRNAKRLLQMLPGSEQSPEDLLGSKGLEQISDRQTIARWVQDVLQDNEGAVTEFQGGKVKAFQFLMGQVFKASQGKANPRIVKEEIQSALQARS